MALGYLFNQIDLCVVNDESLMNGRTMGKYINEEEE
jgi:hypothetical protein